MVKALWSCGRGSSGRMPYMLEKLVIIHFHRFKKHKDQICMSNIMTCQKWAYPN